MTSLVLRDGATPEIGYALVGITIFIWLWTLGAFITSQDLQEPIFIKTIGGYSKIDSNSYQLFLIPDVILTILTVLCFRVRSQNKDSGMQK